MLAGGIMFIVGWVMIIWPKAGVVFHLSNDAMGTAVHQEPEMVSIAGSRYYGVAAIILGLVLVALSLYRDKQQRR